MKRFALISIACLSALFGTPSFGQTGTTPTTPEMRKCYPDSAISDSDIIAWCSAVLDLGKETQENIAVAYRQRGLARSNIGQVELGIKDLDQAILLDPKGSEHFRVRCVLRTVLGDETKSTAQYERAISDCNRAIELNPEESYAFNNRGIAYSAMKRYDEAISDYTKALEISPFSAAYLNRALDYFTLRKYDLALQDVNIAIKRNPDYSKAIELRRRIQAKMKPR